MSYTNNSYTLPPEVKIKLELGKSELQDSLDNDTIHLITRNQLERIVWYKLQTYLYKRRTGPRPEKAPIYEIWIKDSLKYLDNFLDTLLKKASKELSLKPLNDPSLSLSIRHKRRLVFTSFLGYKITPHNSKIKVNQVKFVNEEFENIIFKAKCFLNWYFMPKHDTYSSPEREVSKIKNQERRLKDKEKQDEHEVESLLVIQPELPEWLLINGFKVYPPS